MTNQHIPLNLIPIFKVNFSEPLSFLQRLTEDFEYSDCLDKAASCTDAWEQMAYVAAFTVSSYANTTLRTGKPFNPLLGETFECDRFEDLGWRSFAEQVSDSWHALSLSKNILISLRWAITHQWLPCILKAGIGFTGRSSPCRASSGENICRSFLLVGGFFHDVLNVDDDSTTM